jgi:nucleoside-diphosphate-sugar epimerase
MRALVTGGSGFVGRSVCEQFNSEKEIDVFPVVRSPDKAVSGSKCIVVGDIGPDTAWHRILSGTDLIIHTAARVHEVKDTAADALAAYRLINVAGTLNLARQAADAGVKRFIFLSSIKVNGDHTTYGRPFYADDRANPGDAYGRSKHEAEVELQQLSQVSGMEVVVIRPPLVYGPGVQANFLTMMRWVHRGLPVPLGNVKNRRSLVALDNLVDLIKTCCVHPAAANQVFLVSDDEDVSVTELLRRIGVALQRPARFVPLPAAVVRALAGFTGKHGQVARLLDSLQVDIDKTRKLLGWSPVVNMEAALRETARHYLASLPR